MLPSNCFYVDSTNISEVEQSRLYGYAYTDESLILGSDGWARYIEDSSVPQETPDEGRFAGVFVSENKILIKTDSTGQELLYLYRDDDFWAVSNSFLALASRVSDYRRLTFYPPAAANFHLKDGRHIGEQLVSHRTLIERVTVVPIGTELIVDRSSAALEIRSQDYLSLFSLSPGTTYEDVMVRYLERAAGLLGALGSEGIPTNLSLSGGYDSRLVLALILASGESPHLRINSQLNKTDDFAVASSLCERFNLPLNSARPAARPTLSSSDAIRLYLLSCAGTYLPFYPVNRHLLNPEAEVRLTGDQPSGLSFLAGKAKFNGSIPKIANDIEHSLSARGYGGTVKNDFLSSFADLGLDAEHPVAPLAFYSAIRARFHGGRSWYKSLGNQLLVTPLMHSDMVGLDIINSLAGHRDETNAYASKRKFFADAFSAFGGWVLEEPFETPDRQFEDSMLAESPFRGGVDLRPWRYRVYGSVARFSESTEPSVFSSNLDIWQGPERIKEDLSVLFDRSRERRNPSVFTSADLQTAKDQLSSDMNLSHQSRKLTHVISTDVIRQYTN